MAGGDVFPPLSAAAVVGWLVLLFLTHMYLLLSNPVVLSHSSLTLLCILLVVFVRLYETAAYPAALVIFVLYIILLCITSFCAY